MAKRTVARKPTANEQPADADWDMAPDQPAAVDPMAELAKASAPPKAQDELVFTYDIPASVQRDKRAPRSIAIRELPDTDRSRILKQYGDDAGPHLIQASIVGVNGRRVNQADEEHITIWHTWPPKVQALAAKAFEDIHATTDEEDAAFLKSAQAGVI